MKPQVTVMFSAALIGLVNAGWMDTEHEFSLNDICSSAEDRNYSRVCFTTDSDMTSVNAASNFNGFMSDDKKRFVIYKLTDEKAFLQTDKYIINVNFDTGDDVKEACATADVTDLQGNPVDNGNFCHATDRWIHLP